MSSAPDRESSRAVLVEALVRRAVCCTCSQPRRIAVRYRANPQDESRARDVHAQLRASRPDIIVQLSSDATDERDEPRTHYCAIFDEAGEPAADVRAPSGQRGEEKEAQSP